MSDQEEEVLRRLYRLMADDWELLKSLRATVRETQDRLRSRAAQTVALDAPIKRTARETRIPEENVRRWAGQGQPAGETAGAA